MFLIRFSFNVFSNSHVTMYYVAIGVQLLVLYSYPRWEKVFFFVVMLAFFSSHMQALLIIFFRKQSKVELCG